MGYMILGQKRNKVYVMLSYVSPNSNFWLFKLKYCDGHMKQPTIYPHLKNTCF